MSLFPHIDVTEPARRKRIVIFIASVVITFIANVYGLLSGITVVFSHLLYFPIILAGYWFPRRGILFALLIAISYGSIAFLFSPPDIMAALAIVSRCSIFLVIGVVVSLISLRLHESERQLHDIIEFLPDPTFAIDSRGNVIAWNRAIEEMTGVRKNEMLGRGDHEYALPFYGKREPVLIDAILHESEARLRNTGMPEDSGLLTADVFIPHFHNGKGVHLRLAASALFDTGGRIVGAIESIRDVTDQVITEDALKNTGTRLNMLAGIIRNDLRKNLRILYDLLSDVPAMHACPESTGWISAMRGSADGIQQQIEISGAFRDIGTTPPAWIPVNAAVTVAAGRAGDKRVLVRAWTDRLFVFSDTHISTAFYHVFERSVTADTGVSLVVVTYQIRESGCAIIIEDNGAGYRETEKEGLFKKRDGTFGCGLFLTKEILAITSMSIRETGIFGKGARFEILVPTDAYRISVEGTATLPETVQETGLGVPGGRKNGEQSGFTAVRELTAAEFILADEVWTGYHDTTGDPVRDRIFAAFVSERIVSLARCRRHPDGIEVDGVFTREADRHRGYGLIVMKALTEACHNDELFMYAVRDLTRFYAQLGFVPVTEEKLPGSVRERYRWAAGNMEGADVQPMYRKAGLQSMEIYPLS